MAYCRNGGAHFEYLETLLASNSGGSGFFVGSGLTAADLCVWEIVDLHMRLFKDQMEATVRQLSMLSCWVQHPCE
jgi:glutathione S-transferase